MTEEDAWADEAYWRSVARAEDYTPDETDDE